MNPFQLQGNLITDGEKVFLTGNQVIVKHVSGLVDSYKYDSTSIANAAYNGVKQSQLPGTILSIGSVLPIPADFLTTRFQILGSGFLPNKTYTLHWEDAAGGFDNNGYSASCQWISPFELLTTFASVGDGSYGYMLYLDDGTSISNVIYTIDPGAGTILNY